MYTLLTERFGPRSVVSRRSMPISLSTPFSGCSANRPAWVRVARVLSTRMGDFSVLGRAVATKCRDLLAGKRPEVQFVRALRATGMIRRENWHTCCSPRC